MLLTQQCSWKGIGLHLTHTCIVRFFFSKITKWQRFTFFPRLLQFFFLFLFILLLFCFICARFMFVLYSHSEFAFTFEFASEGMATLWKCEHSVCVRLKMLMCAGEHCCCCYVVDSFWFYLVSMHTCFWTADGEKPEVYTLWMIEK